MSIPPYPLHWPDTMPRTSKPVSSRFKTQLKSAMNNVRASLRAFATDSGKELKDLVISSNVTLGDEKPADAGVAVWFQWNGMQVSIAVDRYPKVEDNLQAIHHIIEARRTELRHGGLHIVQATFRGFQALPAPGGASKRRWRDVLGFPTEATVTEKGQIEAAYRVAAKKAHPDHGGSSAAMAELNDAKAEALREIGA